MGITRISHLKILSLLIVCIVICCVLYQYLLAPDSVIKPGHSVRNDRIVNFEASDVKNHLSGSDGVIYGSDANVQTKEKRVNNDRDDREQENDDEFLNFAMIFTKAQGNVLLRQKFVQSLNSLVKLSSLKSSLKLHLIGDQSSLLIARNIVIRESKQWQKSNLEVVPHDADEVAKKTEPVIGEILKYFIYKPGAYYSDTLFFFSIVLHKIFPLNKIILLDVDIKFEEDILDLQRHFGHFLPENVIGIAREQQPVYRHVFHVYRKEHPGTDVGDPPPHGLTGFNSAVLLLNLQRMRESTDYERFLNATVISSLVKKYKFQGHLGDQDFFTLLSLEKPQLFYILPCGWNRQLCLWWKGHGYEDVFDLYHNCSDPVKLLHGNCNTIIPVR